MVGIFRHIRLDAPNWSRQKHNRKKKTFQVQEHQCDVGPKLSDVRISIIIWRKQRILVRGVSVVIKNELPFRWRMSCINTWLDVNVRRVFRISATARSTHCDFLITVRSHHLIVGIVMQRYPPLSITTRIEGGALQLLEHGDDLPMSLNPWIAEIMLPSSKQRRSSTFRRVFVSEP